MFLSVLFYFLVMMDEPKFAQPIPNVTGKITHKHIPLMLSIRMCFQQHVFMKNTLF